MNKAHISGAWTVTQTSHGECYLFVFLLYNRPGINYLSRDFLAILGRGPRAQACHNFFFKKPKIFEKCEKRARGSQFFRKA